MITKVRFVVLPLVLTAVAAAGCQSRARPADPVFAKDTLRQALDAWQNGEEADTFRQRCAVTVVESQWEAGAHLVAYELLGDGESSGFDWQCKVRLTLQYGGGKKSQEKAVYSISTAPKRVVVRSEGS